MLNESGCGAVGSALPWGGRGRWFKSSHSDQKSGIVRFPIFFIFTDFSALSGADFLYLLSDGHNKVFSDGLKLVDRYWIGPITMPLSEFPRCVGPEEGMRYPIPENYFEKHILKLMDIIQSNNDMPPLIVHFYDHKWELNDGNHRHEAYRRLGITDYPVIVWITEKEEYEEFLSQYTKFLNKK